MRPVFSASGMKSFGRNVAAFRVVPSQQRLGADHMTGREVDLRLVVDAQLVGTEGVAQVAEQLQPVGRVAVVARSVQQRTKVRRLCGVHRSVSALHQLDRVVCVVGQHGDADACLDVQVEVAHLERLVERRVDAPCEPLGVEQ